MVLYYTSSEGYMIYMGADKYENEDLIKYGFPEDIWFHVDGLSSAHVYLRLNTNQKLEHVSANTIMECAQFVKANSIEGCKLKEVKVVYTRWRNLKKTNDMEVGAIGFHDNSKVKNIWVIKDKDIVKQVDKTKNIKFPNLSELQEERFRLYREEMKLQKKKQIIEEKQLQKDKIKESLIKSYSDVMVEYNMKSNTDFEATEDDSAAKDFEDDFM